MQRHNQQPSDVYWLETDYSASSSFVSGRLLHRKHLWTMPDLYISRTVCCARAFAHLCIYYSSQESASSAGAASSCRTRKVDMHAHKQDRARVCDHMKTEEQEMGFFHWLTSVSLTDWDWDAFGTRRIYGRFDAAFLLNYSRAGNNEIAWESGPMVWTSPGVNSPWLNPLHSILHPHSYLQPGAHPLFYLRGKMKVKNEKQNEKKKKNPNTAPHRTASYQCRKKAEVLDSNYDKQNLMFPWLLW